MGLTGKGPYFAPREQSLGKYCLMCGFAVAEPWLCVVCCGSSCFEYPTGHPYSSTWLWLWLFCWVRFVG